MPINPAPPNQEVLNRLLMAKYQLSLAHREMTAGTDFGAWQASITLHDATETCLLALADHNGIPRATKRQQIKITEYPVLLEKTTGELFYDAAAIDDVSETRNPAKHRGQYPGFADVARLLERLAATLDRNCGTYLHLRLSDVSLAEMVQDGKLKGLTKRGEQALETGNFTEAITQFRIAWVMGIELFKNRHLVGGDLPDAITSHGDSRRSSAESGDFARRLNDWWNHVRPDFELLLLGVDVLRARAFAGISPIVHLTEAHKPIVSGTGEEPVLHTAESAHFALTFVIENFLRFQEIERVRQPRSVYRVKVKKDTPYFDATKGTYEGPDGEVAAGTVIEDASFALGHAQGDFWHWKDIATGHHFVIPFEAADVVGVEGPAEHRRRQIEKMMTQPPPKRKP